MPARLTPNQKDRLIDLGRRSGSEDLWVDLRNIGGERTLDHLVEKGYAERALQNGPRHGRILFYRPTVQGWTWLARQERGEIVASDGTVRDALGNFVGIDQPAASDAPSPAALTPPDPLCRNCGAPDSWHSEDDGQCPDDDGPHYDSVAAYDARETR